MREITVVEHMSLDGVMQAPGSADEDTTDGFDRGGWGHRYDDEVLAGAMAPGLAGPGELLFGRATYETFAGFWPHQKDNPFTEVLDRRLKHVVTRTIADPLPWQNSTAVRPEDLKRLADSDGPGLTVLGSGRVVTALREQDLVTRYVLIICPLVLGRGKKLFPGGPDRDMRLVDSVPTTTGAIIATYEPVR
jgi:dihydrofolate reductase